MADYNVIRVAWCKTDRNDKIWGWIALGSEDDVGYNFWGRRGAKLTFKRYPRWSRDTLYTLYYKKIDKGYDQTGFDVLERAGPGFINDFEKQFTLARMFDNFHGEGEPA